MRFLETSVCPCCRASWRASWTGVAGVVWLPACRMHPPCHLSVKSCFAKVMLDRAWGMQPAHLLVLQLEVQCPQHTHRTPGGPAFAQAHVTHKCTHTPVRACMRTCLCIHACARAAYECSRLLLCNCS